VPRRQRKPRFMTARALIAHGADSVQTARRDALADSNRPCTLSFTDPRRDFAISGLTVVTARAVTSADDGGDTLALPRMEERWTAVKFVFSRG
jgi:hypothetical protein